MKWCAVIIAFSILSFDVHAQQSSTVNDDAQYRGEETETIISETAVGAVTRRLQGFNMKVWVNNAGVLGLTPNVFLRGGVPARRLNSNIGLQYPLGSPIEHLYGAGLWVGGLVDTSKSATVTKIKRVTTAFEGWNFAYEMYPGERSTDKFYMASIQDSNGQNIRDVDDDGDGSIDENELDGIDNDGDGRIDG